MSSEGSGEDGGECEGRRGLRWWKGKDYVGGGRNKVRFQIRRVRYPVKEPPPLKTACTVSHQSIKVSKVG